MRIMSTKAFTAGCLGYSLTADEIAFYRDERPWGFIIFLWNIDEPAQVQDLCASFRDAVGDPNAPILIDQEGGRVQSFAASTLAELSTRSCVGRTFTRITLRRGHSGRLAYVTAACF